MSEEAPKLIDGRAFLIRPARQDDLDYLLWGGEHLRAHQQKFMVLQELP